MRPASSRFIVQWVVRSVVRISTIKAAFFVNLAGRFRIVRRALLMGTLYEVIQTSVSAWRKRAANL